MSASIVGFVTRSQAGLVNPTSVSRNVSPEKGGVAIHHGGPAQSAAKDGASHSTCIKTWKKWQNYHKSKDWVDIAYNGGFCNHGYAFAGRGFGVRSGAQGTSYGNQNFYAFVWIGGEGQTPTQLAINAADWWVTEARKTGAAKGVRPHGSFKSTACPGSFLKTYAGSRNGKDLDDVVPKPKPTPTPPASSVPYSSEVKKHQKLLEVSADGKWGPTTDNRAKLMQSAARTKAGYPRTLSFAFDIRVAQAVIDTKVDGEWGPNSQKAMVAWVKSYQKTLGVDVDGSWGPLTNAAFNKAAAKLRYNYRQTSLKPPSPSRPSTATAVKKFQKSLEVDVDGQWGPNTNSAAFTMRDAARTHAGYPRGQKHSFNIKTAQAIIDTKVDGEWGPNSQVAMVAWVKEFQKLLGVRVDGSWGPKTDAAFLSTVKKYEGNY